MTSLISLRFVFNWLSVWTSLKDGRHFLIFSWYVWMEKDGEFGPSKLQDSSVCQLFNCSIYVTWKDSYCTVNYVTAKNSVARKSSTVCMFMFGAYGDSIRGHQPKMLIQLFKLTILAKGLSWGWHMKYSLHFVFISLFFVFLSGYLIIVHHLGFSLLPSYPLSFSPFSSLTHSPDCHMLPV